ncbi:MAG TPA: putative glycolipid-binding domain-containing protein [Solirubrobacteraceae bacterium]|nr:putative glycolipid-binding domain-containing protein [Solirubrobacteraceae bacterium]
MGLRKRAVAWVKEDPFGVEFAEIDLATTHLSARGVAVAGGPISYRLDYTLETTADFITSRLHVVSRGQGWRRAIELRRDGQGIWTLRTEEDGPVDLPAPGGDPAGFADALDCDLGLSPVTNLMPVLRHGLLSDGDAVHLTTAWVSVPDLSVQADDQRYDFVSADQDERVIHYEATDGSFAANIRVDREGIVIDYPGIARRL